MKPFLTFKSIGLILAVALTLAACGGGGGGDASNPVATAPAKDYFAAYVGTWTSDCNNHAQDVVTITSTNSVMSLAVKTNYFDTTACSGSVVATQTSSAALSAVSSGTQSSQVALPPATALSSINVDKITATFPQHSESITGTGVFTSTISGVAQICVRFTNGDSTCSPSAVQPAATAPNAGIYTSGSFVYLLTSTNGVFKVDERFTKN